MILEQEGKSTGRGIAQTVVGMWGICAQMSRTVEDEGLDEEVEMEEDAGIAFSLIGVRVIDSPAGGYEAGWARADSSRKEVDEVAAGARMGEDKGELASNRVNSNK